MSSLGCQEPSPVVCWCPQAGPSRSSTGLTVFVCPESPGKKREKGWNCSLWGLGWLWSAGPLPDGCHWFAEVRQIWERWLQLYSWEVVFLIANYHLHLGFSFLKNDILLQKKLLALFIYSMTKLATCSCCFAGTSVFHLLPTFAFPIWFFMTSVLTALVLLVLDSPPMQTYDPVTFSFLSL